MVAKHDQLYAANYFLLRVLQNTVFWNEFAAETAMAKLFSQHRRVCPLQICWVVALFATSAHVPPTWWQGGWRRQYFGSRKEVELFSQLAAVLMPQAPVCELFRSFPGVVGKEDLEPTLTAYGVLKDPNAALFVLYDGEHGKRDGSDEFQQALLAYGPPGSHILHISHTESRPLEDMVLCINVSIWKPGEKASHSNVLMDVVMQISLGLSQVLCPEVLCRLQGWQASRFGSDAGNFLNIANALARSTTEDVKSCLCAEGFSPGIIKRMLKSARLSGKCLETQFRSKTQLLLNQSQIHDFDLIAAFSPGDTLQQALKLSQQQLSDIGLSQDQVGKAIAMFPALLSRSAEQHLAPTVQWLVDLGLSQRQVVKIIVSFPEVLGSSKDWKSETLQWLKGIGLTDDQTAKVLAKCPGIFTSRLGMEGVVQWLADVGLKHQEVARLIAFWPQILGFTTEQNLKPRMQQLLDLGMTKKQITKAVVACPQILGSYGSEQNLKTKVAWFLETGLMEKQVAKVITTFPQILGCSIEKNLQPKVGWLLKLGLTQDQVVRAIAACPTIMRYSIEHNLKHKVEGLLELGLSKDQVVKVISVSPSILQCSIEKTFQLKTKWFLKIGLTKDQMTKAISAFPQMLSLRLENLKHKVQLLQHLGLRADEVAKVVVSFPQLLGLNLEHNLTPKLQWLSALGLTDRQVAKAIAVFPQLLGRSVESNLNTKVKWLLDLGLTQEQIVQVITYFPFILKYSMSQNLLPKLVLLRSVFGASGAAEVVLKQPQVLGYCFQRLNARLKVLAARNETWKLASAMRMTEDSFKTYFLNQE